MAPLLASLGDISANSYGFFGAVAAPNSFESIQTVTVGAGGTTALNFGSIPQTYSHLEIRGIWQFNLNGEINMRVGNGSVDTGTNYSSHTIYASGSGSPGAYSNSPYSSCSLGYVFGNYPYFAGTIISILDYTSTNKNKTVKNLFGQDTNGTVASYVEMSSNSWLNYSSPIDTISIYSADGRTFPIYSTFSLYGIKGS